MVNIGSGVTFQDDHMMSSFNPFVRDSRELTGKFYDAIIVRPIYKTHTMCKLIALLLLFALPSKPILRALFMRVNLVHWLI